MTTEPAKLKPLSERRKVVTTDFISPEERRKEKKKKTSESSTQIKDDLTTLDLNTKEHLKTDSNAFKTETSSSDGVLIETELDNWYRELKSLEYKLELLNNKRSNQLNYSEQEEIKQLALEIRASSKSIENKIFVWFENLYHSTKKFSSEFVVSNIEMPSISLPKSDSSSFISPKKS